METFWQLITPAPDLLDSLLVHFCSLPLGGGKPHTVQFLATLIISVFWKQDDNQGDFTVETPVGIKARLRTPVGIGRFTAALDTRIVAGKNHRGRRLEMTLTSGSIVVC